MLCVLEHHILDSILDTVEHQFSEDETLDLEFDLAWETFDKKDATVGNEVCASRDDSSCTQIEH